ncbi:MAG: DUF721 domain-containing protein [Flavobacteriales bacterium]|jgi:flagellar biosynthesis/type III secretory pathway protein FliH|nr:DUF721 domain-containing protein [Flavobacteriales bacterium]
MAYYKNRKPNNRNSEEERIDDVVNKLLKAYGLTKNYDEYEAVNSFKKIMGAPIVKYTQEIRLKNKRMYIKLTSSVIREELSMGKSKIIKMINEDLGKVVVLDIVFV